MTAVRGSRTVLTVLLYAMMVYFVLLHTEYRANRVISESVQNSTLVGKQSRFCTERTSENNVCIHDWPVPHQTMLLRLRGAFVNPQRTRDRECADVVVSEREQK
jgi:hypothetical protein